MPEDPSPRPVRLGLGKKSTVSVGFIFNAGVFLKRLCKGDIFIHYPAQFFTDTKPLQ